ncbi:TetR/AcrR family transcriptional regulator [Hoeflea sp. WL0058]|uniref:TetR/AcrR family transcriptional regulator n=1 Tax=Flavimaribacter sediminis TaxID=2865987 RepID=A0AAE3D2M9_9HYPH|nr:TetR/AcrR family transcriptional regulator [Flavimaribacter sediminis]MBW8638753.1 TetR/AcrR family transcriptional regulator [Flavimaribacter sediminis]
MSKNTREQLLESARRCFAAKGFYGASIADIADEIGLTKQALLHHFGSKEKLYGEILKGIAEGIISDIIRTRAHVTNPLAQLEALMTGILDRQLAHSEEAQILMRELLDNRARAEQAGNWYLKPFLDSLVSIVRTIPLEEDLTEARALALVYQFLGSINYFVVSEPTLTQMFGKEVHAAMRQDYSEQLRLLIRHRFHHG